MTSQGDTLPKVSLKTFQFTDYQGSTMGHFSLYSKAKLRLQSGYGKLMDGCITAKCGGIQFDMEKHMYIECKNVEMKLLKGCMKKSSRNEFKELKSPNAPHLPRYTNSLLIAALAASAP